MSAGEFLDESALAEAVERLNRWAWKPEPLPQRRGGQDLRRVEDIAAELGCSKQAVSATLQRALKKLEKKARRKLGRPPTDWQDLLEAFRQP